jgi:branched-chain amino acid transport system permease protein
LQVVPSPLESPKWIVNFTAFSPQTIVVVVAGPLIALALTWFLRHTILGTRMRAVAVNPVLASATGIRTRAISLTSVVLGVVLAGVAAILIAPETVIDVSSGDTAMLIAFTAAAVAGMGQLWGAIAVAFALGIAQSLFSSYVSATYASGIVYAVLLATLIFRPKGVFGAR